MPRNRSPVPDLRRLMLRRRVVRIVVTSLVAFFGSLAICDRTATRTAPPPGPEAPNTARTPRSRGSDWTRYDRSSFTVDRVLDGDTIELRTPTGPVRVRLIGIDAPEMNYEDHNPDHWARQATDALKERLDGKTVWLRLQDHESRDRYERLLAYLHTDPDSSESLNLWLIRTGNAYAHRFIRHEQRASFESTENDARRRKVGLWEHVTELQMPQWRQDWLAERRGRDENVN